MLRALSALRPAAAAARVHARPTNALRAFSMSPRALSDEHHAPAPPQLYGPGGTPENAIPTDEEQATGLERLQLLGRMEGVDVFDMKPLDSSRLGTMADPIKVPTFVSFSSAKARWTFPERLIGCTGSPADSHEVIWLSAETSRPRHRCPECGSVYTLDFQGDEAELAHCALIERVKRMFFSGMGWRCKLDPELQSNMIKGTVQPVLHVAL
ncbi:cytochrome c oxidase subunit VB-domain-containing protein [Phellopilus nigrolimitatus]|nr:cytochrome c oxidase subunit VB-domain-containing protein [Phellopilus nigrolimitatus]